MKADLKAKPIPEQVKKFFDCRLFHSRIPIFTGKVVWDEENQEWRREIVLVCKEGCNGEGK